MFTKEVDNVARALPAFFDVMNKLQNPLAPGRLPQDLPLETIAKSIWLVIPFHFGAFFGLSSITSYEATTVVLVGLAALVALMWIGVALGYLSAREDSSAPRDPTGAPDPIAAQPADPYSVHPLASQEAPDIPPTAEEADVERRERRSSHWVAGLVGTWFFAVFALTALNLAILVLKHVNGNQILWPNLRSEVDLLVNGAANTLGFALIIALPSATVGVGIVYARLKRNGRRRRQPSRDGTFLAACWLVTASLIALCTIILSP